MKSYFQFLNEIKMNNPKRTLERHGEVTEKVDAKHVEIKIEHYKPMTMHDGTVLNMPLSDSWVRVRRFTSGDPFELTSIQVGTEVRGSATIALALVKRARELANEPIMLSDTRSPEGKRLGKALRRMGWIEERDGREWVK